MIDLSKDVSAEWDKKGWLIEGFNGVEIEDMEYYYMEYGASSKDTSTRKKSRLMWLSPETLQILYREYTKLIISPLGSAKLDTSNACFGEDWANCYDENAA